MSRANGILLTGGIGSGKSTAAALLAGWGAAVVSADAAGHRVLEPGEAAHERVASRWPQAVKADGRIDRGRLASMVFADAGELAALEEITHPAIGVIVLAEVERRRAAPLVVVEVPLPGDRFGLGWPQVVVDAPDEVRVARLADRGMEPEEAARRMAAQPDRETWLAGADYVLDNGRDLEHLAAGCRRLWASFVGRMPPGAG
jgi:dephospho-CoA kinase